MSDMLPPLVAEIRARAGQFYSELGKVGASVKKLERETAGGLSPAQKSFHTLARVGKAAALGLAGAAAVVGYESVKMATSFQSQVELLHTAAGESQANLKMVAGGILSLAEATGTSVSQLTAGAYIGEKAGYRGAAMLGVLKAAAQGAKQENVDLGTSMSALTSVMMSYGDKASQSVQVENEIVRASGLAKTTMTEFAGSLSTVIPIASAAHVNFAQVGGAIATLTQHGTTAQEATQELANTIRNLQAPSLVAQKAMQQIGINVNGLEMGLGTRGLTGTLELIEQKMAASSRSGMVVVDAFKLAQSATQDLSVEIAHMSPHLAALSKGFRDGSISYKTYYTDAKALGGQQYELAKGFISTMAASKGFNTLLTSGQPAQRTAAAELKDIMGGATGLNTALMLGGHNMAYFKSATEQVAAAAAHAGKNTAGWNVTSKTAAVQFAQMREGVQVLGIKIGTWLLPKVLDLVHGLTSLVGWLEHHKTVALALAGIVGGVLTVAMAAWVVETWNQVAASLALEGSLLPIILIAAAIGVAILLLWKYWRQAWDGIKIAAMAVWNYVLKPQFDAMIKVWDVLKAAIGVAVGWIVSHWRILATAAATILLGPVGGALVYLATHWSQVWGGIEAVTGDVWRFLKSIFEDIVHAGLDWIMIQVHVFEAIWRGTWNGIRAAVEFVWNGLKAIFGFIVHYGIDPIRAAIGEFASFWRSIWYGIESVIQGVYNTIMSIVNGIENAISTVSNGISTIGSKANSIIHAGGDLNPLNWDVGGWVPGSPGQPVPGIVHGSEYVLSYEMLTGRQAIDPGVVQAVWGNLMRNKGTALSQLAGAAVSPNAPGTALPVTSAAGMANAGSAAGGSGGGMTVVVQGSIIDKDGFFRAVQEAALQHGGRNSQTWAPYARRR